MWREVTFELVAANIWEMSIPGREKSKSKGSLWGAEYSRNREEESMTRVVS